MEKLDIMIRLTNQSNIGQTLAELKEYVLLCYFGKKWHERCYLLQGNLSRISWIFCSLCQLVYILGPSAICRANESYASNSKVFSDWSLHLLKSCFENGTTSIFDKVLPSACQVHPSYFFIFCVAPFATFNMKPWVVQWTSIIPNCNWRSGNSALQFLATIMAWIL